MLELIRNSLGDQSAGICNIQLIGQILSWNVGTEPWLLTRVLTTRASRGLFPPTKGIPVIAGVSLTALATRANPDNWKTWHDIESTKRVRADRRGSLGSGYTLFQLI